VLETEKVQDDLKHEANLILARAALIGGKDDLAMEIFQKLRKINSEIGAESRYSIAKIYFNKGEYKRCEKAIFDLVDEMPSYDDWLAKGFILLADNYLKLGTVFQAKNTLQSVIDNHEGKELKDLAQRKLDEIISNESPGNKMNPQPDQEIEFQNNQKDDGLFDEKQEPLIEESEPKKGEGNE
jgi:tetratricopeptide (TPR) repeat protein